MKDQYFGDVNDFVKFGLLRQLQHLTDLRLGVCWYLTPSDGGPDGARRQYLTDPARWHHFDPDLYDSFRRLQTDGLTQAVTSASTLNLLPGAKYFGKHVPMRRERSEFLHGALKTLEQTDLVFLDPDNGIETASLGLSSTLAFKYVLWDELQAFFSAGFSLLVYQHFPRVPREKFINSQSRAIGEHLGTAAIMVFLTAHVGFFLICQEKHRALFEAKAGKIQAKWGSRIRVWKPVGAK